MYFSNKEKIISLGKGSVYVRNKLRTFSTCSECLSKVTLSLANVAFLDILNYNTRDTFETNNNNKFLLKLVFLSEEYEFSDRCSSTFNSS